MTHDEIKTALLDAAPELWHKQKINFDAVVTEFIEDAENGYGDAERLAHILWTAGAYVDHQGSCVVDFEGAYENVCEPCKTATIAIAELVLDDRKSLTQPRDDRP